MREMKEEKNSYTLISKDVHFKVTFGFMDFFSIAFAAWALFLSAILSNLLALKKSMSSMSFFYEILMFPCPCVQFSFGKWIELQILPIRKSVWSKL